MHVTKRYPTLAGLAGDVDLDQDLGRVRDEHLTANRERLDAGGSGSPYAASPSSLAASAFMNPKRSSSTNVLPLSEAQPLNSLSFQPLTRSTSSAPHKRRATCSSCRARRSPASTRTSRSPAEDLRSKQRVYARSKSERD